MAEATSAIGIQYHTPSMPHTRGIKISSGTRNITCRVSERAMARCGLPILWKKFDDTIWKPTIGIAYTYDFETFTQLENAYLPFNRNGVMFPRKINGEYVMFSRPSDSGHTPFGDMYLSHSKDMTYWGKHRHVMAPDKGWESKKIGAGPIPIETSEGWLVFYHGVLESCNGFVYSFGACILDKDQPWKVKYRCKEYLINPREYYECVGDVQNVTFPCAALCDKDTGRIAIYYGCADTCVSRAFCYAEEVVEYVKAHSNKYF